MAYEKTISESIGLVTHIASIASSGLQVVSKLSRYDSDTRDAFMKGSDICDKASMPLVKR